MATLITGGSGLLGSHFSWGLKPTRKELDLLDYASLADYIKKNDITKIIHSAAIVGGVHANTSLICDFFLGNLEMNSNVLKACREFKLNNSVFILSTCVFPSEAVLPIRESVIHDGEPHHTNYGYAYAKRMLEVGSRVLKQQYGINTTCLIPTNLYGENDNHDLMNGHLIPSLIHKCYLAKKTNTDFVIWGDGTPLREIIYAGDVVRIIEHITEGQNRGVEYPRMIIVSSSVEHSTRQVAELIAKKMGFTGNIVFDTTRPNGAHKKTSDNSVLKQNFPEFTWTELEKGIELSINHFINNYPNIRK
jgi:GDP-L-fucose synthase